MKETQELMESSLAEFRAAPQEAKQFETEMNVVARRHVALQTVLAGTVEDVAQYIQSLAGEAAAASSDGGSRDLSALARAGPCVGYEELKPISEFLALKSQFRSCTSQEDIKAMAKSIEPWRKAYGRLASSCKTAVSDLYTAKQAAKAEIQNSKKRAAKAAAEAGAKRAKVGAGGSAGGKGKGKGADMPCFTWPDQAEHPLPRATAFDDAWAPASLFSGMRERLRHAALNSPHPMHALRACNLRSVWTHLCVDHFRALACCCLVRGVLCLLRALRGH